MDTELIQVKEQHFVFVHGACHGAWCWYKVEALLTSAGHQVSSLDLGASGIDPRQIQDLHSILDYFEPLMAFFETLSPDQRVVLVGHSLAGEGIARAMEAFPDKISAAVFVAASMPGPTLSLAAIGEQVGLGSDPDQMDNQFGYDQGADKPPTSFNFGPKFMSAYVYQNCTHEDVTLATRLVRPVKLYSEEDTLLLSDEKYGSVNRAFVVTADDKRAEPDFQRWMIKNNPPDIVKEIRGADHMVMISKPHKLYIALLEIVEYFS